MWMGFNQFRCSQEPKVPDNFVEIFQVKAKLFIKGEMLIIINPYPANHNNCSDVQQCS